MDKRKNPYTILNVPHDVTPEVLKQAYKKLAFKWHPDKNQGNEEFAKQKFQEISEAYSILGDTKRRRHFDRTGHLDEEFDMETFFEEFDVDNMFDFFTSTFEDAFGFSFSTGKRLNKKKNKKKASEEEWETEEEHEISHDSGEKEEWSDVDSNDSSSMKSLLFPAFISESTKMKKDGKFICQIDGELIQKKKLESHFEHQHSKEFKKWEKKL